MRIAQVSPGAPSSGATCASMQNLIAFMQLASGVDDKTWDYHLRRTSAGFATVLRTKA